MRLLHLFAALLIGLAAPLAQGGQAVPMAEDLRAEARAAQRDGVTLLLMFSADHCPWCMQMEEQFLAPMMISGDYDAKVRIRQLRIGEGALVRDFDGRRTEVDELADRYGVSVTPTLVFLDPDGHQLTGKMVGLTTPDFFGGYLDEAINTALARLHGARAVAGQPPTHCAAC